MSKKLMTFVTSCVLTFNETRIVNLLTLFLLLKTNKNMYLWVYP